MIDPSSITTDTARRAQSSFPTKVRSETTISYKPPDAAPAADDDGVHAGRADTCALHAASVPHLR